LRERRLTGATALFAVLGGLGLSLALVAPASAATRTATNAPGSIGIRLLDAPAASQDDPRARIYIVDHLTPGATIERRIEVSNSGSAAKSLTLYAAAAGISGGSFLGADAHTPNDLTTWTTVSPGKPDVPAGGTVTALVTIAVPEDAAPGEQYGVVWAEARSAAMAGGGITQVSRVGIRLYVSVGPGGPPAADFAIDSLTAQRSPDGRPVVVASVHNTGGRALDMNGILELGAGPGGLSAGPFPATLGVTLGIGETEPVTITLDTRLPAGPWDATVTLHSGLLDRTAKATLTFPATGAAKAVPTKSAPSVWLYISSAGLLVVLLPVAAWIVVRVRRRREAPDAVAPVPARPAASMPAP
jgi:hypothetical protein